MVMPKFACVCSHVINLSHGTSESEFSLVSERKIDEIGNVLSTHSLSGEAFYEMIDGGAVTVYRCPKCDRLHVDQGGGEFSSFIREIG